MESGNQGGSNKLAAESKTIKMFFDGAGCRPNGEGSGFAWICPDSNEKLVQRVPGLTNNQAEYRGGRKGVRGGVPLPMTPLILPPGPEQPLAQRKVWRHLRLRIG